MPAGVQKCPRCPPTRQTSGSSKVSPDVQNPALGSKGDTPSSLPIHPAKLRSCPCFARGTSSFSSSGRNGSFLGFDLKGRKGRWVPRRTVRRGVSALPAGLQPRVGSPSGGLGEKATGRHSIHEPPVLAKCGEIDPPFRTLTSKCRGNTTARPRPPGCNRVALMNSPPRPLPTPQPPSTGTKLGKYSPIRAASPSCPGLHHDNARRVNVKGHQHVSQA